MKKYRLLMNGSNFLMAVDGKTVRQGFFQNMIIEADSPKQAERQAISRVWHDQELKSLTLNLPQNSQKVTLHTLWELDVAYDDARIDMERTFYFEKRWWEFWK
ncbi:hypothetical protein [Desulfoluna sp.]|uniref:hypothetical protein n=1 Tax=Desulfoluna sp. TaxID=2045199 RepID=UPI0026296183|nr:hypothetical protein [Desulfoluna sp.]